MSSLTNTSIIIHTMPIPHTRFSWFTDILRERMKDKNIRQAHIAVRLKSKQATISLHFREPERLLTLDKDYVVRFIREHGFTEQEAIEISRKLYAQDFKQIFGKDNFEKYVIRNLEEDIIPVYASGSAGSGNSEDIDGHIRVPKEALKGHKKDNVYALLVNGTCLVSHDVRFSVKNIAHGDYVAVDEMQAPQNHNIVVYWDNRQEKLIIKMYKEIDSTIILYDAHGIMVPHAQFEDDLIFKGVVFWRGGSTNL